MVAHPGFPVDLPCDCQVPRAPLPQFGVTCMGKTSRAFSKGITLSSSLIRTHAPNLSAPSDFGFSPYSVGLCRLLPAPAASRLFPTLSLSSFPACRDPYSSCSQGAVSRFFPWDIGLPRANTGRRLASLHRCYFGWRTILELQSFLYVPAHRFVRLTGSSYPHTTRVGQPRLLRPRISRLVTCPVQRLC
jgi:hypothetical protein